MDIQLPLLLNLLKDLIDIDFEDKMDTQDKELELRDKLLKNESRLNDKILELNVEREALQDKLEDIESSIINIKYLIEWSRSF